MGALERDEFRRAAWRVMVAEKVDPKRLVFVDEMGAKTSPLSTPTHQKEKGRMFVCLAIVGRTPRCFRA